MKKLLAVLLSVVVLLSLTATVAEAYSRYTVVQSNYFIIGTMTDWQLDPSYRLIVSNKDHYEKDYDNYYFHMYMTPDDSFKIVYCPDGKTLDNAVYYPQGRGNAFNQENPIILKSAYYSFQFRPACDGGLDYFTYDDYFVNYGTGVQVWYYNCIYCYGYNPWANDLDYSNPDPERKEPEPGYYLVGTMTEWQLNKRYCLDYYGSNYCSGGNFALRMCDKFTVAYSEDGVNITYLYPDNDSNIYNENDNLLMRYGGDSAFYAVEFYPNGGAKSIFRDSAEDDYLVIGNLIPPSELTPNPIPAPGELFKAKLNQSYSLSSSDYSAYEELCYHKDGDGMTDWVLIKTRTSDITDEAFRDVIANRICVQDSLSAPFESSYGIYDAAAKEFVPLTGNIVRSYKDLGRIFDKLGEGRLLGDIDCDDELTAVDCTLIQRCATFVYDWPDDDEITDSGIVDITTAAYYSDFDRDGERDIVDATRLQRYVTYID